MLVGEPSLMGGELGDVDERLITRLENEQYDPVNGLHDDSLHYYPTHRHLETLALRMASTLATKTVSLIPWQRSSWSNVIWHWVATATVLSRDGGIFNCRGEIETERRVCVHASVYVGVGHGIPYLRHTASTI